MYSNLVRKIKNGTEFNNQRYPSFTHRESELSLVRDDEAMLLTSRTRVRFPKLEDFAATHRTRSESQSTLDKPILGLTVSYIKDEIREKKAAPSKIDRVGQIMHYLDDVERRHQLAVKSQHKPDNVNPLLYRGENSGVRNFSFEDRSMSVQEKNNSYYPSALDINLHRETHLKYREPQFYDCPSAKNYSLSKLRMPPSCKLGFGKYNQLQRAKTRFLGLTKKEQMNELDTINEQADLIEQIFLKLRLLRSRYSLVRPNSQFISSRLRDKFFSYFSPQVISDLNRIFLAEVNRYKTPATINVEILLRFIFRKKPRIHDKEYEKFMTKLLERLKKASYLLSKLSILEVVSAGKTRSSRKALQNIFKVFRIYEEILVEAKREIFLSLSSNSQRIIEDILIKGNKLVEVDSPGKVEEFELSKLNKTSTSKFLHMMSKTVKKTRYKPSMKVIVGDSLRQGVKIELENNDILVFNDSLNSIFQTFKNEFK